MFALKNTASTSYATVDYACAIYQSTFSALKNESKRSDEKAHRGMTRDEGFTVLCAFLIGRSKIFISTKFTYFYWAWPFEIGFKNPMN